MTNICKLLYIKEGKIFYKIYFTDDWDILHKQIIASKKSRTPIKNIYRPEQELIQLYKEPLLISDSKYNDLQSLKPVIEKNHHAFYDSLKHSDRCQKKK